MVLWLFLLLFFMFVPLYSLIRLVQSLASKVSGQTIQSKFFDVLTANIIYCLILTGFYLNKVMGKEAGEPLYIYEMTGAGIDGYASLANEHIVSVIVLLTLGLIGFWLLTLNYGSLPPLIHVIASIAAILNLVFAFTYLTHTGFVHKGEKISVLLLQFSFVSMILLYSARLKNSLDQFIAGLDGQKPDYENRLLLFFYKLSVRYRKIPRLWAIVLFPAAVMIQLILVLFGQRPDSFIRVFLETSSFNYSIIPAPKPEMLPGDGHYLCTVAAKGHKKLVKPIRAGIRHNERIIVNRQLLITNAFENILEQYLPSFHKTVRRFYDRYGYPISIHIRTKWSADIIYLMMKPLEWFFLFVLYTVDRKPENRISIQYSELRQRQEIYQI